MTNSFRGFLREQELQTFQELLHGPCKDFLQRSQRKGLLVRGMKSHGEFIRDITLGEDSPGQSFPLYKKAVRKERKPMDTAAAISSIIDDWFEDEMGIRARSQAVFCFGEAGRETAYEYGPLVVVLPIGKFTYVWSPEVADLYDDVIRKKLQTNMMDHGTSKELRKEYLGSDGKPDVEKVGELMKGLGYTINGFDKAVSSAVEIMVDCDEYYVIPLQRDAALDQLVALKKAFVHA